VVLPAPRKPVTIVTGVFVASDAAIPGGGCKVAFRGRLLLLLGLRGRAACGSARRGCLRGRLTELRSFELRSSFEWSSGRGQVAEG
jgi:hypothetical protein